MNPIDTSALPVATQLQLSQLTLVSSEMSSLEPSSTPTASDLGTSLFDGGAYLDLSPAAQALIADPSAPPSPSDSAPGPGWELGYDPSAQTGWDAGPDQVDLSAPLPGGF